MAELIMRELTALDPQTGLISDEVAGEVYRTLESWAKHTRHHDYSAQVAPVASTRPMVFVFRRGPEITLVSHSVDALQELLDTAKLELARKGVVLPLITNPDWRAYDVIGRLSYEGECWCKLAFRTAGETDPKRYFGVDAGWSLCGCERDALDRVLPGLAALMDAWYSAFHKSMKGYWLEF